LKLKISKWSEETAEFIRADESPIYHSPIERFEIVRQFALCTLKFAIEPAEFIRAEVQ